MKTKHTLICDNCKHENVLYSLTCKECNHYLRTSVVNIDLWTTIWNLFENPTITIKNIIFAEHKNFVSLLLVLFSVKFYLIFTIFNSIFVLKPEISFKLSNVLYGSIFVFVLTLLLLKIITFFFNAPNNVTRYKDNIAITVYSFAPMILLLLFLTPIEYGIFGINWFDYNPSPILLKQGTAYSLLVIEGVMILWVLFLLLKSYFIQSSSIIKSVLATLFFISSLFFSITFIFSIVIKYF